MSALARAQVIRQGGIPNARHITSEMVSGSASPFWKGGKPDCADCGVGLSTYAVKRCVTCAGKRRAGPLHPNWKGGVTPENQIGRNSPEYAAWRRSVLARDRFLCVLCGQVGGGLHAHHKQSWAEYPHLRYDVNNGITVCHDCHFFKVHGGAWRNQGITFNEIDRIIAK